MPTSIVNKASAVWNGDLFTGSGTTSLDSSRIGTFTVNWKARAEESGGATTPEELIASAHATCYAMQLSNELAENHTPATQLDTSADVTFVAGTGITGIHLSVNAQVDGVTVEDFARIAESAKANCPVSQALAATEITLSAKLACGSAPHPTALDLCRAAPVFRDGASARPVPYCTVRRSRR